MKNIVFIINPFSGTSQKIDLPVLIETKLDHKQYEYEILNTEYAGHAIQLSQQAAANGADVVVAVGGDGSVNEVAQSLLGNTSAALGIIPAGSGNGFAMHAGIGRNINRAIEHLNDGEIIEVDTCKVNDRFFLNVAGIGFDAKIAFLTKLNSKRGFLPYLLTSLKQTVTFKPSTLSITVDGHTIKGKYAAAVIANASMYGYHFSISPTASMQDGILDVMLIKDSPLYKYFFNSYRFLNRTLHKSDITETFRGTSIEIKLENQDYIHVDGEGYEAAAILKFEVLPRSLKVLVPRVQKLKWTV